MKRLLAAAAVLLSVAAGCGSSSPRPAVTTFAQPHGAACHTKQPPQMGECVEQRFGRPKPKLTLGPSGRRCADWSQWQGSYPPTAGLACVIIQSNYGLREEGSVWSQVRDAREHGLACGVYSFMEGFSGGAEARLAVSIYRRTGCTLGLWADAEVGAAYSHACGYTYEAVRLGVKDSGLYTAPGIWPGGRCAGYLWPAEWGSGAYAFGGYPYSAIVLQQTCGTCFRGGTETDLDADFGLIALGHPESESERHAHKARELHSDEQTLTALRGRIGVLRRVQARYGCTRRRSHHLKLGPTCRRWFAEGDSAHVRGYRLHVRVFQLRHEGVR